MKNKIKHIPDKFGFKEGAEDFPLIILVAMASPCNAKCPHCPCTVLPSIRNTEEDFIRPEYFKKLVDEVSQYNSAIRMSGYGEPLLHPQLFELIEYGKNKDIGLSLITNGSLFDQNKIERIINLEIDSIEISVDSHKEKIYKKIRVGLDFNKVKNNIINLVKTRNKLNKKTSIMISIINQPSRNPDIEGARKYWNKIVDKVMIRTYVTWGVLPTDNYGKPYTDLEDRQPCPYPFERLMIDPAGYFRLCPYDDQKLIPPFGRLSKDSVKEIWHGERFNKIRNGHLARKFDWIELCNKCKDYAYRSWTYNYQKALKDARRKLTIKQKRRD